MGLLSGKTSRKAQTATELAVFGTILIFVISALVRQSLSFGHIQNQNLRALRMAMKMSYEHSMGLRPSMIDDNGNYVGNMSRNFASVLLVEDRLGADSTKYGALNRTPVVANAQGTHSRNLFMPIDVGDAYALPLYDMFLNGVHIPMATAVFKRICTTLLETDCTGMQDVWIGNLPHYQGQPISLWWEPNCVTRYASGGVVEHTGCPKFFAINPNNPQNQSWWGPGQGNGYPYPCTNPASSSCTDIYSTAEGCPGGAGCFFDYVVTPLADRFDLDRDGVTEVVGGLQDQFSWQWILVAGFDRDYQVDRDERLRLNIGEFMSFGLEEGSEQRNIILDVDGDLKEERIIRNTLRRNGFGVVVEMVVLDSQDGDLDFTYNTKDFKDYEADPSDPLHKPEPGLLYDIGMYTRVRPGTYLEITEGALVGLKGNRVRSVQKKDHVDIIQRMIQMSNDTGRFCCTNPATCTVAGPNGTNGSPAMWNDVPNPVEACADNCFDAATVGITCFDTDDLILFVRSRVRDEFGREWVTDKSSDDYVDFITP